MSPSAVAGQSLPFDGRPQPHQRTVGVQFLVAPSRESGRRPPFGSLDLADCLLAVQDKLSQSTL
jgi:hypothetical protein